mmetsp:Transcript_29830/g.42361  ORF Transcript_29830/g.42361 Transcript_29830/m.42361 type:complete len:285 (+) Transcript_29830:128-982(+)
MGRRHCKIFSIPMWYQSICMYLYISFFFFCLCLSGNERRNLSHTCSCSFACCIFLALCRIIDFVLVVCTASPPGTAEGEGEDTDGKFSYFARDTSHRSVGDGRKAESRRHNRDGDRTMDRDQGDHSTVHNSTTDFLSGRLDKDRRELSVNDIGVSCYHYSISWVCFVFYNGGFGVVWSQCGTSKVEDDCFIENNLFFVVLVLIQSLVLFWNDSTFLHNVIVGFFHDRERFGIFHHRVTADSCHSILRGATFQKNSGDQIFKGGIGLHELAGIHGTLCIFENFIQ